MEALLANLRAGVQHANTVTVDEALDAAQTLCSGAAPGPTGWTEELVLQLLQDDVLAPHVADLLSDIANNALEPSVAVRMTKCRLLDLPKSATAVRPIAIGEAWLKVASCAMFAKHVPDVAKIFKDLQYGVGTRGGAEIIIHRVRSKYAAAAPGAPAAICISTMGLTIVRSIACCGLSKTSMSGPATVLSLQFLAFPEGVSPGRGKWLV